MSQSKNRNPRSSARRTSTRNRLIAAGVATVTAAGIMAAGGGDPASRSAQPTEVAFHATDISVKFSHSPEEIKRGRKVARAAYAAGFRGQDLRIAIAVAGAETRWRAIDNRGVNRDGSVDYGYWQINQSAHPGLFKKDSWKSADGNARMTRSVWKDAKKRGNPWRPWSTYNAGKHHAWMSDADVLAREVER